MSLNSRLKDLRGGLAECAFAGVVDLEMGMMIGFDPTEEFTEDAVDRLAAAAVAYFESKPAAQVAKATGKAFGIGDGPVNEVVMVNGGRVFAFFRLPEPAGRVACCVARLTDDPAAMLAEMRESAATLETGEVWA
jgi:hypothetical protein